MPNPTLAQSEGFMLYPRGFLGSQQSPQIRQAPRPGSADVQRLQPSLNFLHGPKTGRGLVVNEKVEQLYARMIARQHSTDDAVFRERLLITALNAFGTTKFDYWYSQQKYSPSTGDLHRDFLTDTLQYIQDGRRDMELNAWNALIGYYDHGDRTGVLDDKACEFFGITSNGVKRYPQNTELIDVIQKWVSHAGGMQDMLFTLHILFGAP